MKPRSKAAGPRIAILLADDHAIVREGFRRILEQERDFAVVGEASNGREAVELSARLQPAVVLMDIAMPLLNGLEATRQIRAASPAPQVIILSAHSDDAYVQNANAAGAAGFLLKHTFAAEVFRAIREVHQGRTSFSFTVARRIERLASAPEGRRTAVARPATSLTSREMETLQLIAEGKANKEMAAILGISLKTVEKHREHLMHKLDLHDTAAITRYAISAGIIESSVQLTVL